MVLKNKLFLVILVFVLSLVGIYTYAAMFNPGHGWEEMDCNNRLCVKDNGNVGVGISNPNYKLQVAGTGYIGSNFYAPVMYDANDAGYYINPNSSSQVSTIYANNWFRAQGSTGLYFQDYGGGWYMTDNTWIKAYNNKAIYSGSQIQSGNSMQAPIFYDSNNTGYYVDPTGWSRLNSITLNQNIRTATGSLTIRSANGADNALLEVNSIGVNEIRCWSQYGCDSLKLQSQKNTQIFTGGGHLYVRDFVGRDTAAVDVHTINVTRICLNGVCRTQW
jgi:hypothetical protein